ncbi:hypothetical protein Pfo_007575 [Paulownia fortunei]|nr:hypothetical protein Pfo_007575 [Paulownia fortunei]
MLHTSCYLHFLCGDNLFLVKTLPNGVSEFSVDARFLHTEMDKLQLGNRKWLRCVKMRDSSSLNGKSDGGGSDGGVVKKKITSRVVDNNSNDPGSKGGHALPPVPSPHRPNRWLPQIASELIIFCNLYYMELGKSRSSANDNRKASTSSSPEKEVRYYTKRGSGGFNDGSKLFAKEENRKIVWPRLLISLSSKEKERDFMLMKGCKPPQRPNPSPLFYLQLVSPGAWLSDLCQERYEVREKTTSMKKPRGLKAMGRMETDSE